MRKKTKESVALPSGRFKESLWQPSHWCLGLVLFVTIAIYILWFYAQPGYFGSTRLHDLVGLLLPDDLLRSTMGGSPEHLQVGVLDRLPVILGALLWLLAASWIGRPVVLPLSGQLTRLELSVMSTLIGLSLLSTVTLLMGLAGWLSGRWVSIPVLFLCLMSYLLQRRLIGTLTAVTAQADSDEIHRRNSKENPFEELPGGQTARWLWRMVHISTFALGVIYLLSSSMPPSEFDVVEYHLQGPKEFYQAGHIDFVSHNVYLNMPLGSEMHALAAMTLIGGEDAWWFGALVGKLIVGSFSLLAAFLAAGFAARNFGTPAGWAAAALVLALPGNLHVAGCGLVDSVLGAYVLATAIALQCFATASGRSIDDGKRPHRPPSDLKATFPWTIQTRSAAILSASILAGASVSCKYTGLVFIGLPAVLVLFWIDRSTTGQDSRKPMLGLSMLVIFGFAITAGPWLVKNAMFTGNPVFPLAHQWLGHPVTDWTDEQSERWNNAHRVPAGPAVPGWPQPATSYGMASILGGLHRLAVGSPMLHPTLVPLAILSVLMTHRRRGGEQQMALLGLLTLWLLFVWWLATHRIDRFWLPAVPLIAVLASSGFLFVLRHLGLGLAAGLLLLSNIYGTYLGLSGALCDQRWFVSLNSLRIDHGIADQPGRIPKTTGWVNQNLPRDSQLLLIGEARAFDFLSQVSYATCFNTPPGESGLKGKSAAEQAHWLQQQEVTHVLIHWGEISRYRSPGNYGFSSWPNRSDIDTMVSNQVLSPVAAWPVDPQEATLLRVIAENEKIQERSR